MAGGFPDLFSDRSDLYATARPRYPPALFDFIAASAPDRRCAWDCATGNGQAAVGLASRFARVEASDASAAQIAHAIAHPHVHYSVQPAEGTAFPASSFDAVCVAQALHWFDPERFYREVKRVLVPGGVLVACGYAWFAIDPDFDRVFEAVVLEPIRPFWAPQNALVWNGYRDVDFPFERLATPELAVVAAWNLTELMDFVLTWSATRRCIAERGDGFFRAAFDALMSVWAGATEARRSVSMPLSILAGTVPAAV